MQSGYQGTVLILAAALGITELFARQIPQSLAEILNTGQITQPAATNFWHGNLGAILLTLLFIAGASYIAGLSDDSGKLMLALVIAVWLLFLIKNASNLNSIFGGGAKESTAAKTR